MYTKGCFSRDFECYELEVQRIFLGVGMEVVVVGGGGGKVIYQSSEVLETYIFHRTYKWQNLLRLFMTNPRGRLKSLTV